MRTNSLKAKLGTGQRVVGVLLTLNSPEVIVAAATRAGRPAMVMALLAEAAGGFLQALRA